MALDSFQAEIGEPPHPAFAELVKRTRLAPRALGHQHPDTIALLIDAIAAATDAMDAFEDGTTQSDIDGLLAGLRQLHALIVSSSATITSATQLIHLALGSVDIYRSHTNAATKRRKPM